MGIKFKYIAIDKTLNIILRNMQKSPERCSRNLLELGATINSKNYNLQQQKLYPEFLELCKNNDKTAVKDLFCSYFLE